MIALWAVVSKKEGKIVSDGRKLLRAIRIVICKAVDEILRLRRGVSKIGEEAYGAAIRREHGRNTKCVEGKKKRQNNDLALRLQICRAEWENCRRRDRHKVRFGADSQKGAGAASPVCCLWLWWRPQRNQRGR